jgi:hypothetical protein
MSLIPDPKGRENCWLNPETGLVIFSRPGMTVEQVENEWDDTERHPKPEAPRDLLAEFDALKSVLIEEDPTRAERLETKERIRG